MTTCFARPINMSDSRVVIFDLWQTLADAKVRPSDLFNRHIRQMQVCSKDTFLQQLSLSDVFLKDIPVEVSLRRFLLSLGIADTNVIAKLVLDWKAMARGIYFLNGAVELLQSLKTRGHLLCLLTNSDKYGYEYSQVDSLTVFDYRVVSYQRGFAKPDKRCWETIHKQFNVDYSEMIMVGDSVHEDIMPAKELGLSTIQVGEGVREISRLAE